MNANTPKHQAQRFPPWTTFKAIFSLIGKNFHAIFNIWAITSLLLAIPFCVTLVPLLRQTPQVALPMIDSIKETLARSWFITSSEAIIGLLVTFPILHITLGKLYPRCNMEKCNCLGRFWFKSCTCGGRLWKMATLVIITQLLYASPVSAMQDLYPRLLFLILPVQIIGFFIFIALTPLMGAIAINAKHSVSLAWQLSRHSFWRLAGGFCLFPVSIHI